MRIVMSPSSPKDEGADADASAPSLTTELEEYAQRQLHLPRVAAERGDGADRRRVRQVAVGQAVVDVVEHVEDVPAEHRAHALADADALREGEVEALPARPTQHVARLVAERAGRDG